MPPEAPETTTAETAVAQPPAVAQPLDFTSAGDILDKSGDGLPTGGGDALADTVEADALADSKETNALATDNLDDLLADVGDDTVAAGTGDDTLAASDEPDANETPQPDQYARLPARIAAIMRHADAAGVSFEEAETAIFGTAQTANTEAKGNEVKPFSFEEAEREIETLKAERREAAKLWTEPEKALALTEKIEAKQLALATERARQQLQESEAAREQRTHEQQRQTKEAGLITELNGKFPDAFKPGHKLYDAVLADRNRLSQSNPAFFNDPEWPDILVRRNASRLGIVETKPGASASASPAATAARTVQKPNKTARPLPAPGGRSATPQTSATEISNAIKQAQASGDAVTLDYILANGTLPPKP